MITDLFDDLPTLGFDLMIPQGVDWPGLNFPISGADGEPYNLAECSARAEIRPYPWSPQLYFAWSTSPTSGQGLITLSGSVLNIRTLAVETSPWRFKSARYDIVLINLNAPVGLQVSRLVMGQVTVSPRVTIAA